MHSKVTQLRNKVLSYGHVFDDIEIVDPGDVFKFQIKSDLYVYIVCTDIIQRVARFSGYDDSGKLYGEYRWESFQIEYLQSENILRRVQC